MRHTPTSTRIERTREQLFEEAWTRPMTALSKEYGLSNVGLAKIFKTLDIPRPGLGHWARKSAGQKLTRPPLPPCPKDRPGSVLFHVPAEPEPEPPELVEVRRKAAAERAPDQRIVVSAELARPHPLIRSSAPLLRRAKEQSRALLEEHSCLDIHVSPAALDRALRIMDALLKALETRGLGVELVAPTKRDAERSSWARKPGMTMIRVGEDRVPLALTESRKEVERAVPNQAAPFGRDFRTEPRDRRKEYHFTGSLTVVVGAIGWESQCKRIRDGRTGRLEEKLNLVVAEVLLQGELRRQARLKREEDERQRQEEERRKAEEERRRKVEAVWVHDLTDRMKDWRVAAEIRAFADAVEARRPATQEAWHVERWLAWARRYAGRREASAFASILERVRLPPDADRWSWQGPSGEQRIELPTW